MEPTDLTIQILQDIRSELRDIRGEMRTGREETAGLRHEFEESRRETAARFEVIETALRDLAQQMVMLSRGIKVAIEDREHLVSQIDDHERRLRSIEEREHQ